MKRLALVIDCGATNVRAAAVDPRGRIVASEACPNAAKRQFRGKDWLVWDIEDIWAKMMTCASAVVGRSGRDKFAALAVTSFSDDGAPVDGRGNLLYPVVSWQCLRTAGIARNIDRIIDPFALFKICGEQTLHQHTLFRLQWLREECPDVFGKMRRFVMFPGLINRRLTGVTVNDPTTGDSMMLMDIKRRDYSERLLSLAGLDRSHFPPVVEPGTVIGMLRPAVADKIGIGRPIPVVTAGHDTQFAVVGSGCGVGEAVLSSGTWEILFLRRRKPELSRAAFRSGIKNECDAVPGIYNVGQQWIGSGVLEWLASVLDCGGRFVMERKAECVPPGCRGLMMEPSLMPGPGSAADRRIPGGIMGLNLQTDGHELYRAALEGLSFTLRRSMETMEKVTGKPVDSLIVVGGGSKNVLWNRIRADVLGRPVRTTSQKENTVIGAAMFAFIGAGLYRDADEARKNFRITGPVFEPGKDGVRYDELFESYCAFRHSIMGTSARISDTVRE